MAGTEQRPRRRTRKTKLLFRYANILDLLLMLLGSVFGTLSGLALPLVILIYGYSLDEFTSYDILDIYRNASDNYFCTLEDIINPRYFESNDTGETLKIEMQYFTYYTLGLAVIVFVASSLARLLWAITGSRQAQRIRLMFFQSVLTRQVGWYDSNPVAEIPPLLSSSIPEIEKAIGTHMTSFVQDGVTFLTCFVIALSVNWELTLVTSVLLPVIFVIVIALSKVGERVTGRQTDALNKAGAVAEEALSAIKTVVAFGGQDKEIERYANLLKVLKKQSVIFLVLISVTLSFLAMMILQYFALGFWYASRLYVECSIKPGEMLVVITEVMLGTFTLAELLPELKEFLQAKGASQKVFEIIDQESDINALSPDGEQLDHLEGNIEFSNVTFAYPSRNDLQVLHELNLSIKPGQTVALVGTSGCGKSTIMKLIPRIYEYNIGNILIDGKEIRTLNVGWLRSQIGIVSQEPVLFNVSIYENISYGNKDAKKEDIERAAKAANAHDFINQLPYKYDTIVGEGGSQISGGQKQRIAIARALVRNPKILLLDEATSALDLDSERAVQEALDKASEGRTTIIIAHRLSTIHTADVIVGIDKGRVVEMGSHSELMEKQGLYYKLVMSQSTEETDGAKEEEEDVADAMVRTAYMKQASINSITGAGSSLSRSRAATMSLHRGTKSSTIGGRVGASLLRQPQTQMGMEYPLQSLNVPEGETSIYAGFEDEPNAFYSFKDSFVTLFDLLKLTLNCIHWVLLISALVAFVLAGGLFTYNFAVLKELVEQFRKLDKDELLDGVVDQTIQFASIGAAIFILYILGISMFGFVGIQVVQKSRENSFKSMVKQSMAWFDEQNNSVSILSYNLTTQATDIFQLFDIRMGSSLRSFVTTIGVVILSFQISWVMALIVLPAYVFMFIGAFLQVVLTKKYADKSKEGIEETAKITIEFIENVHTVTTLGIEERLVTKYEKLLEGPANDNLKSALTNGVLLGASKGLVYFCIGIGYIVGAHIFTADSDKSYYADIAEIFTVIVILMLTSRMFKTAFSALPDVHKAILSAEEVVFMNRQRIPDSFGRVLENTSGKIQFEGAHFYYPTNENVKILRGLTISVEPGKTLAFVGPSGSGKSTTLSLLEKFYKLTSGSIMLDGSEIKHLKDSWLRQQISLVSQEPVLFDMSIADNIRYGANFREVTDEEIQEAAKSANIHDFIISLSEGYNTIVGSKLSGGEKQRIAIARALVRNPKILLLDEATSALDMESERVVQEALDKAREGRTTVIIAHRLSTIQNADCIAVLHRGRVIEHGTHSELMDKKGAYYRMHTDHKQILY